MNELDKFRSSVMKGPSAEGHWPALPAGCRSLYVVNQKLNTLAPLLDLPKLEQLSISIVRDQDLEILASLKKLRALFLGSVNTNSLAPLGALKNVEVMDICHAAKLESLRGLENYRKLRVLRIYHIPRVKNLRPLAGMASLVDLSIQMSWGTDKKLRFESLEPLGSLRKLRCLELIGVQPLDGSLKALARLQNLKELHTGYTMPVQEYAFLAGRLTRTKSDCFHPIVTLEDGTCLVCRKCKTPKVLLVGKSSKRSRQFVCPDCDQELVAEHVRLFEDLVRQSRGERHPSRQRTPAG